MAIVSYRKLVQAARTMVSAVSVDLLTNNLEWTQAILRAAEAKPSA